MDAELEVSRESVRILFIDDDSIVLKAARLLLARQGYEMFEARSAAEGRSLIDTTSFELILLDLNFSRGAMTGSEGLNFLSEVMQKAPDSVVVVVTAHSGVNIAVKAIRLGAHDFITKPWRNERFLEAVNDGLAASRQRRSVRQQAGDSETTTTSLLGHSRDMDLVRHLIARSAPTDASVLITGGAGMGKALAAEHIHRGSRRRDRPFVRFHVALAPPDRLEAQLESRIREAEGATLLLHNIEALPQSALERVGEALRSGVRILSTTQLGTAELEGTVLAERGLTYQLATVEIAIPPLRDRREDIAAIAEHYSRVYARRYGRDFEPLDPEALQRLSDHDWPGGVRQLMQLVERSIVLGRPIAELLAAAPPEGAEGGIGAASGLNLQQSERRLIERSLLRHGSNVTRAALELGLTRAALYRRMQKYGL